MSRQRPLIGSHNQTNNKPDAVWQTPVTTGGANTPFFGRSGPAPPMAGSRLQSASYLINGGLFTAELRRFSGCRGSRAGSGHTAESASDQRAAWGGATLTAAGGPRDRRRPRLRPGPRQPAAGRLQCLCAENGGTRSRCQRPLLTPPYRCAAPLPVRPTYLTLPHLMVVEQHSEPLKYNSGIH